MSLRVHGAAVLIGAALLATPVLADSGANAPFGIVNARGTGTAIANGQMVLVGVVLLTIGAFMMTRVDATTSQVALISYLAMMGLGMGASVPAFLIAVQSAVRRRQMGTATATRR